MAPRKSAATPTSIKARGCVGAAGPEQSPTPCMRPRKLAETRARAIVASFPPKQRRISPRKQGRTRRRQTNTLRSSRCTPVAHDLRGRTRKCQNIALPPGRFPICNASHASAPVGAHPLFLTITLRKTRRFRKQQCRCAYDNLPFLPRPTICDKFSVQRDSPDFPVPD